MRPGAAVRVNHPLYQRAAVRSPITKEIFVKKPFTLLAVLILSSNLACAADDTAPAADADGAQVVQVSGLRHPELRPYKRMLEGIEAFEHNHRLAPDAALRFKLTRVDGTAPPAGTTLQLRGDHTAIAIAVAGDGGFSLPFSKEAADDGADLVSNQKTSTLRWHADIHTPNVPANARRLGDLRLECEVAWAIGKADLSFISRNAIALLGGPCGSKRNPMYFEAPSALAAATLVEGERSLPLKVIEQNRRVFAVPLGDAGWTDDALIRYDYGDAAAKAEPAQP